MTNQNILTPLISRVQNVYPLASKAMEISSVRCSNFKISLSNVRKVTLSDSKIIVINYFIGELIFFNIFGNFGRME
jgi:hypothetical protein